MATRTRRTVPWLASDVVRGFVGFVPAFIVTTAYNVLVPPPKGVLVLPEPILLGWICYAGTVIVMTWIAFGRQSPDRLTTILRATRPPEGRLRRFLWTTIGGGAVPWAVTGSVIAVTAVILFAINRDAFASAAVPWLAIGTIAMSWAVTANAYAVWYARESVMRGGTAFPGRQEPVYSDYVYLAVQLGTTFAGSDVQFTTHRMRRIATVHSILSFAFNTVIVALLVSVLINTLG
jgi:uncharacterized membrane protein